MNAKQFGEQLVLTGDLDPVYLMLNSAALDPDATARWCLAYWMFYHTGVASKIAEHSGESFWAQVWAAQVNKWPRGTERRHFRGENANKAIQHLEERFPNPEDATAFLAGRGNWDDLVDAAPLDLIPFELVAMRAKTWVGFGPWIAFKIADMIDCVVGIPVVFPSDSSVWYEEPIKGAVWAMTMDLANSSHNLDAAWEVLTMDERRAVADALIPDYLQHFTNTVGPDGRGVRVQELETIFCKYKSHLNGHYPIGKDTREILHGLTGWGDLAGQLQQALRDATPQEHHG